MHASPDDSGLRSVPPRASPQPRPGIETFATRQAVVVILIAIAVVVLVVVILTASAWQTLPDPAMYKRLPAGEALDLYVRHSENWFTELREALTWVLGPVVSLMTLMVGALITRSRPSRDS